MDRYVLGMSYKKDIDDLRESPSLTVIELLRKKGVDVLYNTIRSIRKLVVDGITT